MLEKYFVRPETVDRIRASWISEPIERYVRWLTDNNYRPRNVHRRVPILMRFGDFAAARGATGVDELPSYVEAFVGEWLRERGHRCTTEQARRKVAKDARTPVEQMLRLVVAGFEGSGRPSAPPPFQRQAPGFFDYLRDERGLREETVRHYCHHLRRFAQYLARIGLAELTALSPPVLSAFVVDSSPALARTGMRGLCGVLRVFLRYLYRENLLSRDLSATVESPQAYRLSHIPRSITWDEVRQVLETLDRRSPVGRRDYAILLLLVTYGLRAREVAALTLDDIDWRGERLRVPERKAGHSTAFPLSPVVGEALLDYIRDGRPKTSGRHVFFRAVAPPRPLTHAAISSCAGRHLRRVGVDVPRPGSHTFRHTCVQRLVDADFSFKEIGDYVGHRSPASTQIYGKVAVEALREVALGDGEEVL